MLISTALSPPGRGKAAICEQVQQAVLALADMRKKGAARKREHDKKAAPKAALRNTALPPPGRGKVAIREQVQQAILALAGLPPAAEVAGYFGRAGRPDAPGRAS